MAKRRDLFDPTDPTRLEPGQRLAGVAAILAAGVIRMRQKRRAVAAPNVRTCPDGRAAPSHRVAVRPRACRRFRRNPAKLALSFPAEVALMASVVNALRERGYGEDAWRWTLARRSPPCGR